MLTIKPRFTLSHVHNYFKEHLQVGDYYSENNKVLGQWIGKGAEQLSLNGSVHEQAFLNLAQGLHPSTGEKLTQRLNTTRMTDQGKAHANRRLFYDFCISPPKSVSIVAQLQDPELNQLHHECVVKALKQLEKHAATRVRKGGVLEGRYTQNLVAACFQHETSRALDPHLHTHCIVMNVTYDPQEQKWKALQNSFMLKAQQAVYACYLKAFAQALKERGYTIERTVRDFEIKGISSNLLKTFSKRHEQIETLYQIEKGKKRNQHLDEKMLKAKIAYEQRDRKIKGIQRDELEAIWKKQLTPEDIKSLTQLRTDEKTPKAHNRLTLEEAFEQAEAVLFERATFSTKEKLLAKVAQLTLDCSYKWEAIESFLPNRGYLKDPLTNRITLPSIVEREKSLVRIVKSRKGLYAPFNQGIALDDTQLSFQQAAAVKGILNDKDFAVFLKGSAGTGKSFTLKVLAQELQKSGHTVQIFAPQHQQVLDLNREGLEAQTVASLLLQKKMPVKSVWIIDEAGQIADKQMAELLELAQKKDCRVIFSGDTKQHGAVEVTDALQLLERYAHLKTFKINQIRRQNPKEASSPEAKKARAQHKQSVKAAAKGNPLKSIQILESIDCIHIMNKETSLEKVAKVYSSSLAAGKKCLVVSQTNEEVNQLNRAIKTQLKTQGHLGIDHSVRLFSTKDLTGAQKKDSTEYAIGNYVFFHKKYGFFEKGELLKITDKTDTHLLLEKEGKELKISLKYADHFNVCSAEDHNLAEGELLQVKFNGLSQEGKPVHNGEQVTFLGLDPQGDLRVQDEQGFVKTIDKNKALLKSGYALTSYASQGKTVDQVFIYDSQNRLAVNEKEWYVSISRSKEPPVIYTANKEALFQNILQSGDRGLSLDTQLETLRLEQQTEYYLENEFENQSALEFRNQNQELSIELEFEHAKFQQQQHKDYPLENEVDLYEHEL